MKRILVLGLLVHAACASMYSLRGKIDAAKFVWNFRAIFFYLEHIKPGYSVKIF